MRARLAGWMDTALLQCIVGYRVFAIVAMTAATLSPVFDWMNAEPVSARTWDRGTALFWLAWAALWSAFASRALHDRDWWRYAFCVALALVGIDTVRIRLDLFASLLHPGASTPWVWIVRISAGWVMVAYLVVVRNTRSVDVHG